jgi:hypothetical protein
MSADQDLQRVEHVTQAVVVAISRLRAAFTTIDGGHEFVAPLMGREGEKRIIRIALNILGEIGIQHKTDRTVRRAIAYKLRAPPIGFTQVESLESDR